MWLTLLGCALHATHMGLVERDDDVSRLLEETGRSWRLVAEGDAAAVHALHGCRVEVSGQRLGRRLLVQEWTVIDAGDGSAPFVGRLRRYGSHWMIDDRGSSAQIFLEGGGDLAAHEGRTVMVVGYVVGAHRVRVVSLRPLD